MVGRVVAPPYNLLLKDSSMEILYSDKNIAVCIKPVSLDSEAEVPNALKEQLGGEIFPIHRLDKNVGGMMVYARTKQAAAALSKAVQEGPMVKESLPNPATGKICCGRTSKRTRSSLSNASEAV